jgi:transcriptional regulator with XRE-family HTH domain
MRYTIDMNVVVDTKNQREFGDNVRSVREKRNLSQEQVAEMVGISISYYAGIERGEENPTFAVIKQLCKILRVKSSEILPF